VYLGLYRLDTPGDLDVAIAIATVLAIRLAAIRWHLGLPRFHLLDRKSEDDDQ